MVARKKIVRKTTEAKKQLIILAVYPEPVGLTPEELKTLQDALKAAGDTVVKRYAPVLETAVALVPEMLISKKK